MTDTRESEYFTRAMEAESALAEMTRNLEQARQDLNAHDDTLELECDRAEKAIAEANRLRVELEESKGHLAQLRDKQICAYCLKVAETCIDINDAQQSVKEGWHFAMCPNKHGEPNDK